MVRVGALAGAATGPVCCWDVAADAIRGELLLFTIRVVETAPVAAALSIRAQRKRGDPDGFRGERGGGRNSKGHGSGALFCGSRDEMGGRSADKAAETAGGLAGQRRGRLRLDIALCEAVVGHGCGQRRIVHGEYRHVLGGNRERRRRGPARVRRLEGNGERRLHVAVVVGYVIVGESAHPMGPAPDALIVLAHPAAAHKAVGAGSRQTPCNLAVGRRRTGLELHGAAHTGHGAGPRLTCLARPANRTRPFQARSEARIHGVGCGRQRQVFVRHALERAVRGKGLRNERAKFNKRNHIQIARQSAH